MCRDSRCPCPLALAAQEEDEFDPEAIAIRRDLLVISLSRTLFIERIRTCLGTQAAQHVVQSAIHPDLSQIIVTVRHQRVNIELNIESGEPIMRLLFRTRGRVMSPDFVCITPEFASLIWPRARSQQREWVAPIPLTRSAEDGSQEDLDIMTRGLRFDKDGPSYDLPMRFVEDSFKHT